MVKIVIDNMTSKIVGHLPDEVHSELNSALSYRIAGAEHIKIVKTGKWDGFIRLYYKSRGQSFYSGLVSLVVEVLKKHEIKYSIVDYRERPEQNLPDLTFNPIKGYEERDYQDATIDLAVKKTRGLLKIATGGGKCLGRGTPVMMFNGKTKPVEDIIPGDLLMGPDSTPRTVISTTKGYGKLYNVIQNNGDNFVCNDAHILCLKKESDYQGYINITAEKFYNTDERFKKEYKGYKAEIELKNNPVDMNPYIIGLWIGINNSSESTLFTKLSLSYLEHNNFIDRIEKMNISNIPDCYKYNDKKTRLKLLAGLIDVNGTFIKNDHVEFISNNEQLLNDTCWIARSVGFFVSGNDNMITINGDTSIIPTTLKFLQKENGIKHQLTYDVSVESIGMGEYFGFEIDKDRKFLLGDFTVTHNTVITTKLISALKTAPFMFYVLTKDLMDQTYDTLSTYLNVPIGRIGGGHFDIKNINVCTIQTVIRSVNDNNSAFKISDYMFDEEDKDSWDSDQMLSHDKVENIKKLLHATKGIYMDECITGDSLVKTELGEISFLEAIENKCKYIQSIKNGNIVMKRILNYWKRGTKDTIKIIANDNYIKCTKNHPILTNRGWINAEFVTLNDQVLTKYTIDSFDKQKYNIDSFDKWKWENVTEIKEDIQQDVFDVEVEETHCFFANNILVHNCHHTSAKSVIDVLKASPNAYWKYGGSATPYREDNAEIMIQAMFGNKIVDINASYLIQRNFLVTPYIFFTPVEHNVDLHSYKKIYKECIVDDYEFNQGVANTAKHLLSKNLSNLILVQQYDHGDMLKEMIPGSEFVTSRMSNSKRENIINDLRTGKLQCMIASSLADEGLDVKRLDSVILAGGGASSTRVHQRIGRTLRVDRSSTKSKSIVIVYDHKTKYLHQHALKVKRIVKTEPNFKIINSSGINNLNNEINLMMDNASNNILNI